MHNAPYSRNMTGTDDKPSCFERQARLHTTARPRAAARATADAPANPRQKTSLTIRRLLTRYARLTIGRLLAQGARRDPSLYARLSPNAGGNRMMSDASERQSARATNDKETSDAILPPNDRVTSNARCPQGSIAICQTITQRRGQSHDVRRAPNVRLGRQPTRQSSRTAQQPRPAEQPAATRSAARRHTSSHAEIASRTGNSSGAVSDVRTAVPVVASSRARPKVLAGVQAEAPVSAQSLDAKRPHG